MRLLADLSGFARLCPTAALADAVGLAALVLLVGIALG